MNNKFLVLLGAGSSHDYGFPLWEEMCDVLKIQFAEVEKRTIDLHVSLALIWIFEQDTVYGYDDSFCIN